MSGDCCVQDGYGTGSLNVPNLVADRLTPAGVTWQAFCENTCPRGPDHFPFLGFAEKRELPKWRGDTFLTTTEPDETYHSPNIALTCSSCSDLWNPVNYQQFLTAANFRFRTQVSLVHPTDCRNMHNNSNCTTGADPAGCVVAKAPY